jgi:O-methyltransferase involved in polyketide biosynthesis
MEQKEYSSISPSALALSRLKALTHIPFAKETASFLEKKLGDVSPIKQPTEPKQLFGLVFHFENRYYTIEKMLADIDYKNIMELSSGYSFRGLNLCLHEAVNFIDTDLEGVIAVKKEIAGSLVQGKDMKGNLQLFSLNVMEEADFLEKIDLFPEGPVTLLNEGLLVYLDTTEKKKLCAIIHKILQQRGGQWITGDIYIRNEAMEKRTETDAFSDFRKLHKIDENKFEDYQSAEAFFDECGFRVVRREAFALEQLSCLDMLKEKKDAFLTKIKSMTPVRETWCLVVK